MDGFSHHDIELIVIVVEVMENKQERFSVPCHCLKYGNKMSDDLHPVIMVHITRWSCMYCPLSMNTVKNPLVVFYDWWMTTGGRKHCPYLCEKTMSDNQRCACSPFWLGQIRETFLQIYMQTMGTISYFFKSNFILIPNLIWSYLDILEIRRICSQITKWRLSGWCTLRLVGSVFFCAPKLIHNIYLMIYVVNIVEHYPQI